MRKEHLTLEEWREIGQLIKKIRIPVLEEMMTYNKNSRQTRLLRMILRCIDCVKDTLSELVLMEFRTIPEEDVTTMFYGPIEAATRESEGSEPSEPATV